MWSPEAYRTYVRLPRLAMRVVEAVVDRSYVAIGGILQSVGFELPKMKVSSVGAGPSHP